MAYFELGQIVYHKSDLDLANPLVISQVPICMGENYVCEWYFEGMLKSSGFIPEVLVLPQAKEQSEIEAHALLKSSEHDYYGLKEYSSILANSFYDQSDSEAEKSTRFVYNFKKYARNRELIAKLLKISKLVFDCETIVCIPAHDQYPNELQKLFGEVIKRISPVEKRKYSHNKALDSDYSKSYVIDYKQIKGRVLLVDDIIQGGKTIDHFAEVLQGAGFEVVKFSIGLEKKLRPILFQKIFISS